MPKAPPKKPRTAATAESMAAKQKEIAVSEFFAKNRHLLGFDNPRKALLTTIKEAVDNSLDACEEAGILPEVHVIIEALNGGAKQKPKKGGKHTDDVEQEAEPGRGGREAEPDERDAVQGHGAGQRPRHRQGPDPQRPSADCSTAASSTASACPAASRGIGISAAGMYGLLTTGQPVQIVSKTSPRATAHRFELAIDTLKNRPEITVDEPLDEWLDADGNKIKRGTSVTITLEGKFARGPGERRRVPGADRDRQPARGDRLRRPRR